MGISEAPPLQDANTRTRHRPSPWPMRQALVPALAVGLLTALLLLLAQWLLVDELSRRALLRAQHRAVEMAEQLDAELRSAQREVQLLARALQPGMPMATLRAELEFLRQQSGKFVWLGMVGIDGRVLAATQGWLEGRSIATRPVFRRAIDGSFVGDVHTAVALAELMAGQGQPAQDLLDIGEPVRDADGRVIAVLAAHLGTGWIDALRRTASGETGGRPVPALSIHVVTGVEGRSLIAGAGLPEGISPGLAEPKAARSRAGREYLGAGADLGSRTTTRLLPWRVIVLQPRDAALAPAHQVMRSMAALGLAVALLVAVVGVWLSRRLLAPWSPLFETVLSGTGSDGGPGGLAARVRQLAEEIAQRHHHHALSGPDALLLRLARDASDLRRIVDQLPIGLALIDAGFRIEYVNPAHTRLLGWTPAQLRGRVAVETLLDAVERSEFARQFELLGDPPGEFVARFFAHTPGGAQIPVQWHFVPLCDADGHLIGALALVHDIRPELAARARADAMAGRMRALAEAAQDELLCTLDADGGVIEWSRGGEHLTGLATAAALGRPLAAVLGVDGGLAPVLLQARRSGRCAVSWRCAGADGGMRHLQGSVYPLGLAPGTARFGVILRDVTESHQVHEALQRSAAHMRLAVEAARIGTWEIDLTTMPGEVTWSEGYAQTFGVPADRLPGTREAMMAMIHPDDHAHVQAAFVATVRDGRPLRVEFRIQGWPGWRWHELHGHSLRGADGRALRLTGIGIDITERKQAEAELHAGRERLEQILQTMAEGLVTLDAAGRYTLVNHAAEQMVGAPAARIVGRRYDEMPWCRVAIDGHVMTPAEHAHARLKRGLPPIRNEVVAIQPPGQPPRVTSLNAEPVFDGTGQFAGVVMTFVDISESWRAEQALADNQARLAAVVQGASDAVISVDSTGHITLFNPAAERIFGRPESQMLGSTLDTLLPEAMGVGHADRLRRFAESGESRRAMGAGRVQGRHASGRRLELEASISQVRVGGQPVLTAILRDITDRVAHEQALETTRRELAQLNQRLLEQEKQTSRRLAQALHDELGQTLSAMRLNWDAGQTANEAMRPRLQERFGALVVAANQQIRQVLRDLRPPLLDELGLEAALDNEIQQQRPLTDEPRLALLVPARLRGQRWPADVEYASFMIGREALLNALQHARARHIEVALDGDELALQLRVRDDGIGIPAEVQQGRAGHLGLVGMRERARAIGAQLQWSSEPGAGTVVTLSWAAGAEAAGPDAG